MENKIKNMLPYLGILAVDFYLLPFLMRNTGAAMLIMLCIMPLIALLVGLLYGIRHGFNIWLAATAFLLFIPTLFIHYNLSAGVYAPVYAVIVLLGNGIGRAFYGKK